MVDSNDDVWPVVVVSLCLYLVIEQRWQEDFQRLIILKSGCRVSKQYEPRRLARKSAQKDCPVGLLSGGCQLRSNQR